jgi:hypothetical protein
MIFTARWEILEPRFKEAKYRAPSTERCSEIARSIIADYEEMQRNAEKEGMGGLDSFNATFHRELRAEVEACGDEWTQLTKLMRATPADNPEELSRQLKDLLGNNARWLAVVGKQFTLTVVSSVDAHPGSTLPRSHAYNSPMRRFRLASLAAYRR